MLLVVMVVVFFVSAAASAKIASPSRGIPPGGEAHAINAFDKALLTGFKFFPNHANLPVNDRLRRCSTISFVFLLENPANEHKIDTTVSSFRSKNAVKCSLVCSRCEANVSNW